MGTRHGIIGAAAFLLLACANGADARQAAVDREMKLVADQASGDLGCDAASLDGQIVREIGAQRDYRVGGCGKAPIVYSCETPEGAIENARCVRALADLKRP